MNAANDDGADEEELRRRKGSTGPTQDEELLAKMLALLTREQRQYHQNTVDFATEAQACEASVTFRLDLAKTYLQGLPQREEAIQIGKHIRDERDRVGEDLLAKRLALLTDEQRSKHRIQTWRRRNLFAGPSGSRRSHPDPQLYPRRT